MERFFKLIPLKPVLKEEDRPNELSLLSEEENMTSDFVGITDEDKATFNADMLLLTDVVNLSRTNDNTALLLNLDKPENKQKVTLLHLDDTISELRDVNDKFDALSNDRTNERTVNVVGTVKEIRHRLDLQYDYIATTHLPSFVELF